MNHSCQHCGKLIVGSAYRVTSKEDGVILLDLVVCSLCSIEAKRLRLHVEEINVNSKVLQFEIEGITGRKLEFNCGSRFFEVL
jgi:hypothetical protein